MRSCVLCARIKTDHYSRQYILVNDATTAGPDDVCTSHRCSRSWTVNLQVSHSRLSQGAMSYLSTMATEQLKCRSPFDPTLHCSRGHLPSSSKIGNGLTFRHPNNSISYVLPTKRWSRRVAVYFTANVASEVCARAAFAKIVDDGR
jgi:hypothetical protein